MADVVSQEVRSRMMSGIRAKDTQPEMVIRKGLHALGYRYRLHPGNLPGKPDIVLPRYNAVIFVHGCFWHGHNCHLFKWPKSRTEWWRSKIERNREKDSENIRTLREIGWRVLEIWECAMKGKTRMMKEEVINRISGWLESDEEWGEIRGVE